MKERVWYERWRDRFIRVREKYGEAFWDYFGEFFREASVLVAVFGLLDRNRTIWGSVKIYVAVIGVITVSCFLFGLRCWRNGEKAKERTADRAERAKLLAAQSPEQSLESN
jgi:hypothetical protein